MIDDEQPVRLVLDSTALAAYASLKGMAVAELIRSVAEEPDALVGVPAGCFLTAHAAASAEDQQRLVRLISRPEAVIVVLPLMGGDVADAVQLGHTMGHAVLEARRHGAYLATYDDTEARRHLPDDDVLHLSDWY